MAARYTDDEHPAAIRAAEHLAPYEAEDLADSELAASEEPEMRTAALNPRAYATAATTNRAR